MVGLGRDPLGYVLHLWFDAPSSGSDNTHGTHNTVSAPKRQPQPPSTPLTLLLLPPPVSMPNNTTREIG